MSNQQRKVLVTGVGRSGTTSIYSLLQKIFEDQFPDQTDYVYEPFLWDRKTFNKPFSELAGDFKKLASVSIDGVYHHKNMPLFCDSAESVAPESRDWLQNLFSSDQRKNSLVKMIRGNGRIELIRQLVPDLKIIAIFRNPLDVINSSIKLFSFFGDEFHDSDHRRFVEELEAAGTTSPNDKSWKGVHREFHYWESMCNHLIERYSVDQSLFLPILHEQFVMQREQVVQQICEFTGLEFHENYVSDAAQQVGPTQYNHNNLTVQEYLFLEKQLERYSDMAGKLTSFDMNATTNRLKEKFITSEFAKDSTENTGHFNSHYLTGYVSEQESQMSKLQQQLANAQAHVQSLKQRADSNQEKESQIELYRQLLQKLETELRQYKSTVCSTETEVKKRDAIIQQKSNELTAQDSRIVSLENALSLKDSLIQKREQDSTASNTRLRKFEEDLSATLAAHRIKERELTNATSRILELQTLLTATQKGIADKDAETLKLKQELANATSRTLELQTLLTATQKKVAEKDAKVLKLREDLAARAAAFRIKEQEQTNTTLPSGQKTETTSLDDGIQARVA